MRSHTGSPAPVVWLLTDNKPGHHNQLKGLGNRLRVLAGASVSEIDATEAPPPGGGRCLSLRRPWIKPWEDQT